MRVLIVDDEQPARARLRRLLNDLPDVEVVGEALDGHGAVREVKNLQPDVVLLDIRMPGMDGMATAEVLNNTSPSPAIIFTTAYEEHALEAFDAEATDYLLKPIRKERLQKALLRADAKRAPADSGVTLPEGARSHLAVNERGSIRRLAVADVVFFQADNKYVTVFAEDEEMLLEDSLKQLEEEFGNGFVRIHRNALVARDRLVGMEKLADNVFCAVLRGRDEKPEISRRHVPTIRKLLRSG